MNVYWFFVFIIQLTQCSHFISRYSYKILSIYGCRLRNRGVLKKMAFEGMSFILRMLCYTLCNLESIAVAPNYTNMTNFFYIALLFPSCATTSRLVRNPDSLLQQFLTSGKHIISSLVTTANTRRRTDGAPEVQKSTITVRYWEKSYPKDYNVVLTIIKKKKKSHH